MITKYSMQHHENKIVSSPVLSTEIYLLVSFIVNRHATVEDLWEKEREQDFSIGNGMQNGSGESRPAS